MADVYDALITRRPYKEPWPEEQALRYISGRAGTQFDPEVVEAFLALDRAGRLPPAEKDPAPVPAPTSA